MSQPVVETGVEAEDDRWVAEGEHIIASHVRPNNSSAWRELSDTKQAIRMSRRGGAFITEVLRTVRPESRVPENPFRWRHPTLPVAEEHQITVAQLDELRERYAKEGVGGMDPTQRRIWADNAGMQSVRDLAGDGILRSTGRGSRKSHLTYGMISMRLIVSADLLDPAVEEGYEHLVDTLNEYDQLRQNRNQLEAELEAKRLPVRVLLLGASAVRATYRLATGIVYKPVFYAYVRWVTRRRVTKGAEDVKSGRRLAFASSVVALAVAAAASYRFYKSGSLFNPEDTSVAAGVDAQSPSGIDAQPTTSPSVPAEQPVGVADPVPDPVGEPATEPEPPRPDGGSTRVEFSQEARVTTSGEGWISQLNQMNIKFSPDFMDKIGPWLEAKGYAYRYVDPLTGALSWGMNERNIDPITLLEIYQKAKEEGAVLV